MKKLLLLSVLLALAAPLPVRAEATTEEAAIKKLYEDFCTAWNKHDPKAMAAVWVADGDVINPFGRHARGTAEIEKLFTDEHTGPMASTTYTGTTDSIRHLGKNYALVESDGVITGLKAPDGTAAPPFKHHLTWIAEKKDGKWITVATRAFVYVPPPPAPAK